VITYSEYRYYAQPVWSPDGAFLRVALPPVNPLDPGMATELWYLPADGSSPYKEGDIWSVPFFDTPVSFSPDLAHLIYLAEAGSPSENRRELRVARADGTDERVYYSEYLLRFLSWGQDGKHFGFVTSADGLTQMGSIDGSPAAIPGDPNGGYALHWVDEQLYVFVKEGVEGFELYLVSLDGGFMYLDTVMGPPPALDSFVR
jgi:hypothetical protein